MKWRSTILSVAYQVYHNCKAYQVYHQGSVYASTWWEFKAQHGSSSEQTPITDANVDPYPIYGKDEEEVESGEVDWSWTLDDVFMHVIFLCFSILLWCVIFVEVSYASSYNCYLFATMVCNIILYNFNFIVVRLTILCMLLL